MKLVAGTYERFLWGWQVQRKSYQLSLAFSYPAHLGPIKCAAACGSVVATGGTDDTIKVFDVTAQRDMGTLYHHSGAITCLDFFGPGGLNNAQRNQPTHLLSGSEDGNIAIWDTDSWAHLKSMKGHKSAVNSLSIHHSGRVVLSVERNGHLKMWSLLNGRCTFTTKLPSEGSLIKFSPESGDSYSLIRGETVEVYNVEDGGLTQSLHCRKRVLCLAQHEDRLLITGGEDCALSGWDTRSGKTAFSVVNAHPTRIKGVAILSSSCQSTGGSASEYPYMIATASSDGSLRVWDMRTVNSQDDPYTRSPLFEHSTKARVTCLVACGHGKSSLAKPQTNTATVDSRRSTDPSEQETLDKVDSDNMSGHMMVQVKDAHVDEANRIPKSKTVSPRPQEKILASDTRAQVQDTGTQGSKKRKKRRLSSD